MDIKNLAELGKLADICRKKGIDSIKITQDTVEFKLKENLTPKTRRRLKEAESPELSGVTSISSEDLLFWSSAGLPELSGDN